MNWWPASVRPSSPPKLHYLVIGTRRGDEVAPGRDLARQARHGTGDLVDFGEEDEAREFGGRVVRDCGAGEEDAWKKGGEGRVNEGTLYV